MPVRELMIHSPITIDPNTPVTDALKLLRQHRLRCLPVVNREGRLTGIVAEKDLLYTFPSPNANLNGSESNYLLPNLKVKDIMPREVVTIEDDCSLLEAARIMLDHKVSALPVVHNGAFVGIMADTDLFAVLLTIVELREQGIHASMTVPSKLKIA